MFESSEGPLGNTFKRAAVSALLMGTLAFLSTNSHAQDASKTKLSIELNALQQDEGRCRLVFLARNESGTSIEQLSFETVLFNKTGTFLKLTLFDFQTLKGKKSRVRQFAVPDVQCDGLGRILINGVSTCKIDGAESPLCEDRLDLSTRTSIEFLG